MFSCRALVPGSGSRYQQSDSAGQVQNAKKMCSLNVDPNVSRSVGEISQQLAVAERGCCCNVTWIESVMCCSMRIKPASKLLLCSNMLSCIMCKRLCAKHRTFGPARVMLLTRPGRRWMRICIAKKLNPLLRLKGAAVATEVCMLSGSVMQSNCTSCGIDPTHLKSSRCRNSTPESLPHNCCHIRITVGTGQRRQHCASALVSYQSPSLCAKESTRLKSRGSCCIS